MSSEESPLHRAVVFSKLDIMQSLLDQGIPVDIRDCYQDTPLHVAQTKEAAELLINNNADLEAIGMWGLTPLMSAVHDEFGAVALFLIKSGADVNYVIPSTGWNALHFACAHGWRHLGVIRLLVNKVSNINAMTRSGDTALSLAADERRRDVMHFLIQSGADVRKGFSSSYTLLHRVAYEGWTDIAKAIVGEFDVNATTNQGRTALMLAARRKHRGLFKLLLKYGADIHLKDDWNRTALSDAIPDVELITLLIKNGAYLEHLDYTKIYENNSCREGILQNKELCTFILINNYNNLWLPTVHQIYSTVEKLPLMTSLEIKTQSVISEIRASVGREIQMKTFCNVMEVRPFVLQMLAVRSLFANQV